MKKTLENAILGQVYYVDSLKPTVEKNRLMDLGMTPKTPIMVSSIETTNAVIKVGHTRLAIAKSLLGEIYVTESLEDDGQVCSLDQLPIGKTGIVTEIRATGQIKRRLMDMGVTRGVKIFMRKHAPLGDPVELYLRGYALSLRKSEAAHVQVKQIEEEHD
jgi:ferrous iron transport protein A